MRNVMTKNNGLLAIIFLSIFTDYYLPRREAIVCAGRRSRGRFKTVFVPPNGYRTYVFRLPDEVETLLLCPAGPPQPS